MNELDMLIGRSQRNITYGYMGLFTLCLIGMIVVLAIHIPAPADQAIITLLTTLLSVLGTILVQQSSFWFARSRAAGVPDPTTTTTTQTTETTTTPSPPTPPQPPVAPLKINPKKELDYVL